ncbi:unnamed protein product [Alopecurus aequalis]
MSMPDEFVIFHAEGKISNGPDGAEVSPSCPFVVRRLAEMTNLSFHQMQRVIMDMFHLNEATHELTLQHIVYVGTNPSVPPYRVLIDIIGQDSWRAFLDVGLRCRGFRLYARWNVKKTTSISSGFNIGNTTAPGKYPAITDESDDGNWPTCKHDKPCTIEISRDPEDPGRRFYRCPFYTPGEDCKFTKWLDKKFPKKANEVINKLQGNVDALQRHVDNLKCEVEELRRRQRKRWSTKEASVSHAEKCSCGKSPCDLACRNQDEQKRPIQIPKLARENKSPGMPSGL